MLLALVVGSWAGRKDFSKENIENMERKVEIEDPDPDSNSHNG